MNCAPETSILIYEAAKAFHQADFSEFYVNSDSASSGCLCFPTFRSRTPREAIKTSVNSSENVTGKDMVKAMASYIWPKGNWTVKRRVLIGSQI